MSKRKESKVSRYIKAPFRFLMKARDLYVRGMIDCSGHFAHVEAAAMGCPTAAHLPRTLSVTSSRSSNASDQDFRELVRAAASLRNLNNNHNNNRFDDVIIGDQQQQQQVVMIKVPRSRSVTIGRIDEDKPCDFGDDVMVKPFIYPRSRSYAIRRGGTGYFN